MPPERANSNPNNIVINGISSSSVSGGPGNTGNTNQVGDAPRQRRDSPNHHQQQDRGERGTRMIGPEPPPPSQQHQPRQQQRQRQQTREQQQDKDQSSRRADREGGGSDRQILEGTSGPATTTRNMANQPPPHILQLWSEVAENLSKHQTVVWTKAVDSLESGRQHLRDHPAPPLPINASVYIAVPPAPLPASSSANDERVDSSIIAEVGGGNDANIVLGITPANNPGREFVDRYIIQIISILLEQQPMKIGQSEKDCVEKSVRCALQIVKDDLEYMNDVDTAMRALTTEDGGGDKAFTTTARRQRLRVLASERNGGVLRPRPCPTLDAIGHVFSKKKVYYKTQRQWSNGPAGLPEFRNHMISVFRRTRGFVALAKYLEARVGDPIAFPNLELCREILGGVYDGLPGHWGGLNGGDNKNSGGNGGGNNNNNNVGGARGPTVEPSPADVQALSKQKAILSTSRAIASAIMKHMLLLDEITLKKMDTKAIEGLRSQLHRLYREMSDADVVGPTGVSPPTVAADETLGSPRALHEFFVFWRELSLRLITSQSLPLKLFGWDEIASLITESEKMAPPPRWYRVSGAGTSFINGIYEFDPRRVGPNGYVKSGVELQYHRRIPLDRDGGITDDVNDIAGSADIIVGGDSNVLHQQPSMPAIVPTETDGAGKTITLFRCTMRSSQKWWFLSEADEDQPGTDKDVDYYQHKSKRDEESLPSQSGWLTCRAGADPPPTIEALGKMLPKGEEYNTLEHQLAKWAIENGVIELMLGDGIHREVVSRSAGLIKFLAGMSGEDGEDDVNHPATMSDGERGKKKYCLKASHLLLAWKTCTNKADAAVSAQIYQLLVSILPSLPSSLAIPLIEAIRFSLDQRGSVMSSGGMEKQSDHFFEVSEFCCAIAEKMLADSSRDGGNNATGANDARNRQGPSHNFNAVDPVREAILNLQWTVLSHKDALTLKSYESIKKFVSFEICKHDATTDKLRTIFLMHTRDEISKNVLCTDPNNQGLVDETHALHMVQLAKFLLEGCDREEMVLMISGHNLHILLFSDLISYMMRRSGGAVIPMKKSSSMFNASDQSNHAKLLSTRLQNLRFVYGLNIDLDSLALDGPKIEMSCEQLVHLWNVCSDPIDREALMIFLANASKPDDGSYNQQNDGKFGSLRPENSMHNIQSLSPCFSDNLFVFEKLFCADVGGPAWEDLNEMAYQSFQSFDAKELRVSSLTTDALWKICLSAGNDVVASWAMNDLLAVYKNNSYGYPVEATRNGIETNEDNLFSQRIFSCLVQVKEGLRAENRSSERSAERCIRILSAAIDQCNSLGGSARALADRLTMFHLQHQKQANAPLPSVEEYLNLVPHGMRGVFSCDTVSIIARATSRGVGTSIGSSSSDITAGDEGPARYPSMQSERFLLEIHPLQSLASIKSQIALRCNHDEKMVKFINLTGHRRSVNCSNLEPRISALPDSTLAADLGIMEGSEIIALLSDKFVANNNTIGNNGNPNNTTVQFDFPDDSTREKRRHSPPASSHPNSLDLNGLFSRNGPDGSSNLFFDTLIAVLETLPVKAEANNKYNNNTLDGVSKVKNHKKGVDTHSLAWDLLLAMPTNTGIIAKVHKACSITSVAKVNPSGYEMAVEPIGDTSDWASLLDFRHFELSVYVMQILDSFLRPAPVMFSSLPGDFAAEIFQSMFDRAKVFRSRFIESGGFDAVLRLFITSGKSGDKNMGQRNKMGNEFALRIIQECFFGNNELSKEGRNAIVSFNEKTMSNFLNSLVSITIENCGVSDNAILRVLKLARLMLESGGPSVTTSFTSLPGNAAETFLTSILLWKGSGSLASASIRSAVNIRKCTEEMILAIPLLSASALPWLVKSLKSIDPFTDGSDEFFSVLLKLVSSVHRIENAAQLRELGTAVCIKIASCPRPNNETANIDHTTGVLCGCLKLLIALIEVNDGDNGGFLLEGSRHVMQSLSIRPWSDEFYPDNSWQRNQECMSDNDKALVDLMGSIFDGFISSARSSGLPPICCDKVSRQLAFNVISAAAQACDGGTGYCILSHKINIIIANVAPALRHRWGQNASVDDTNNTSRNTNSVRYSGLKNQGCTCYMNSVLQQLFMMPALRKNLCSAEVPSIVRSAGGGAIAKGGALVGKKISVHWENGNKYDAVVASYKEATGMHTINYCPIHFASGVGNHQQRQQLGFDISTLPRDLPEEYILTEGRPGKETGAFEIPNTRMAVNDGSLQESGKTSKSQEALSQIKETPDEASSRKLLEEVQRTFVNLDEARGRCYDPRALVEASHCLKLEFDVWQQNDASEFAMKMLDRLEISLKKWSPSHFKFLAHTFGMKKTTQKICRECGLKTNREEDMMNIDCQIRNKTSIHEALSDMCEDEIMEGDNKVLCDSCKVKTNTVLRTAISALPDVLVLSLKRFDLDYTTFETVKLNSRCEFGEALNMKKYTLQAKEVLEAADRSPENDNRSEFGSTMDIEESETKDGNDEEDPLSVLPDEDYEYRLAGVLVHAGVAQGGHYYSFIKDRTSAKWYRFDDEDVTPFDPSSIEHECFGGKVKKETKFPNGNTHTVESEQFANALMLFYEKVKPVQFATAAPMEEESNAAQSNLEYSNGYDMFLPEVRKSNSIHSWQSFLLTDEFQKFVKEILDVCAGGKKLNGEEDSMDITPASSPSPVILGTGMESWRLDGIRMSLSFVFDVLFHLSLKKDALDDWSKILQQVFSSSYDISAMFVSDLAKRTHQVYENWVRAFTMECPEEGSRRTALQIFSCAISSLLNNPTEQSLLQHWTQSWESQVSEMDKIFANNRQGCVMPTRLEAVGLRPREDLTQIGVTATSIGIILSFLTQLIEVSPRYTQANIELCFFIRELASCQAPTARILRDAMVEAHFIARLSCLAIREKTHEVLRTAFPGSSLPLDVVEAISREETLSSNIMHVGMNNSGIHGGGRGSQLLLEAIGCLLGTTWIKQEAISFEKEDVNRGRNVRALTPRATEALTAVFEESKPRSSSGMILRDINLYLQKCGQHVPPQRIDQIFSRHAVDEPDGSKLLTLEGFLAYYRDAVHSNEYQVQKELHAFGFRPDLTRRHDDCRWYFDETGQKHPCSMRECIANDLVMNSSCLSKIHDFTELGLQALYFLNFAQTLSNNGVVEYILAASAIFRDSRRLIFESLGYLYEHLGNWNGGSAAEGYPLITMILSVLTAIRDEKQQGRIATVMINDDGEERQEGLMTKGERILQRYPADYHARAYADKCAGIITMLQKQHAISNWMSQHRSRWTWIKPDAHPETAHPLQSRSDHSGRRGGGHQSLPAPHHQNNDPNAEDESDLDDDSRSDEDEEPIREIVVQGCGVPEINGIFARAGSFDGVSKYTRHTQYQGREEEFSLFRCKLTDNTRRWYISIVPMNAHPGTVKDIDFYAAAPSPHVEDGSLPPRTNWMCIPNSGGIMPAPEVYPRSVIPGNIQDGGEDDNYNRIYVDDEGDENQVPGNIVVDQDQAGYL